MKSPILEPGFGNGQETDWSGVCGSLLGPGFWAPPRPTGDRCPGVRRAPPRRGQSQ
ncbi:unnamed protein product, partial [Staurois parvus]